MHKYNYSNSKFLAYAVPAIIVIILFYLFRGIPFKDDAYIFYRYASNWAEGLGPVYNIGEYVEGYSSILWTALLAGMAYLSLDVVTFAPIVNLFIGIFCFFLINRISSYVSFSKPRLMFVILPLICSFSYGFYYYAASGMDAVIFSLVLLIVIESFFKSSESGKYLAVLPFLILLNLVRAEGPFYSVVLLAVFAFFIYIKERRIPKQLVTMIIVFSGVTFLMFLIRYSLYGEWVPATVLAKGYASFSIKKAIAVGDQQSFKDFLLVIYSGFRYEAFLLLIGGWLPFLVLAFRKITDKKSEVLLWLIASGIAANIFVSVWAGGDYMPYQRHFVPVLPLMIIFIAWSLDTLLKKYWNKALLHKAVLTTVISFILVMWVNILVRPAIEEDKYVESGRDLFLRQIGVVLKDIPVPTTLLSNMIGKISYYAGPNVYVRDILGLTDIHNAKYGDVWGFNMGKGACGRSDYNYNFSTPFDILMYNSTNVHNRFISFCQENKSICKKYRFFKKKEWADADSYIIADINHPVSEALKVKFGAVPVPVDSNIVKLH